MVQPGGVGGVVVRMGDDDGDEVAFGVDGVDGGGVEQGDEIPEDGVASGGGDEDGALADGEFGFGDDAGEMGVVRVRVEDVVVGLAEGGEGGEGLAGGRDELAGIVADAAVALGGEVLCAAGGADGRICELGGGGLGHICGGGRWVQEVLFSVRGRSAVGCLS